MAELGPLLRGRTIHDVRACPPRDLVLVIQRDPSREDPVPLRLRLSAQPDAARVHLDSSRVPRHRGALGPFFRRVTEDLVGAHIASLEQVRGDRIALLELRDAPCGERRALLAELFGRHANLVLLGPGDVVLEVLVPPPAGKSHPRLVAGEPWRAPGGRAAAPADAGPTVLETFSVPDGPMEEGEEGEEGERGAAGAPGTAHPRAPLSELVERSLGVAARELSRDAERRRVVARIARRLERARRRLAGLEERRAAAARAERVRQDGELLKAALGSVPRGASEVVLVDWFEDGAPERRIALDPALSPKANLQRLFDRYHKLERSGATLERDLAEARRTLHGLEALERASRSADEEPARLEERAVAEGLLEPPQEGDARKRKPPAARLPYRTFTGSRGSEIRIGRGARDNDQLTFHHARGNDLWIHTADSPGSHVVLRLERDAEPHPEEVLDAAHLAIHFSPQRGTDRAPVHVARRKLVHKPRGAPPGLVTLSGGRLLEVRVQPGRLERLLRTRPEPAGPGP